MGICGPEGALEGAFPRPTVHSLDRKEHSEGVYAPNGPFCGPEGALEGRFRAQRSILWTGRSTRRGVSAPNGPFCGPEGALYILSKYTSTCSGLKPVTLAIWPAGAENLNRRCLSSSTISSGLSASTDAFPKTDLQSSGSTVQIA